MYAVNDTTLLKEGRKVETFGTHSEAVKAAQDRAKPSGSTSFAPTANVVRALDFDDAEIYVAIVDVDLAQAEDVAAEADQDAVAALLKRSSAEIEAAHAVEIAAKPVDHAFEHKGARFPAGSFVAMMPDSSVGAFEPDDFAASWRLKAGKPKRRKPAGSSSSSD